MGHGSWSCVPFACRAVRRVVRGCVAGANYVERMSIYIRNFYLTHPSAIVSLAQESDSTSRTLFLIQVTVKT